MTGSFFPSIRGPSGLQTTLPDVTQNAAFFFFLSQRTTLMQRQSVIKTRPLISPQTKSVAPLGLGPPVFRPRRSLDPYVVVSVFRSALRVQHTGRSAGVRPSIFVNLQVRSSHQHVSFPSKKKFLSQLRSSQQRCASTVTHVIVVFLLFVHVHV